jgi:hypothetical protein
MRAKLASSARLHSQVTCSVAKKGSEERRTAPKEHLGEAC